MKKSNKKKVEEFIRVDHAGERGAIKIYEGQLLALNTFIKKFEKVTLIILSLTFFTATLLASYHFGIEQGFIKESLVCDLDNQSNELSKEALLNQLKEMPVSCKDVTFKIFGLSLATFNIFISFILGAITTKLFLTYEKIK